MEASAERGPPQNVEAKQAVIQFLMKLLALCLAILAVFTFVFGIRQASGNTMYPRVMDGDLMLYFRLEQSYAVDDVVVFQIDGHPRVARIVAQEGDEIGLDDEGNLLVNGHLLDEEDIFYPTQQLTGGITYPYVVEENSYFLLCDYRTGSSDSRYYGAVKRSDLDGKVITILRRRGI